MDFEQQYYSQKTLNSLHKDQIKALQGELDYYQNLKWFSFRAWLYKREMIGWILFAVVGFAWLIIFLHDYL